MENILSLLTVLVMMLYVAMRLRSERRRLYLPDMFIASLLILFIGCGSIHLGYPTSASRFITLASGVSLLSALVTQIFIFIVSSDTKPQNKPRRARDVRNHFFGLVIVALLVSGVILVLLVNANFRTLLVAAFTQSEQTLLAARKSITASTEGYMAPGLLKLIRDFLAPATICSYVIISKKWKTSFMFWIACVILLTAIIMSGQRFPVLVFLISLFIATLMTGGVAKLKPVNFVFFIGLALVGFTFLNILLGRADDQLSITENFFASFEALFDRIFVIVPNEALKSYAYWSQIGPTGGKSWVADLSILLPGAAGETFANDLHSFGGGSTEGNAPLFFALDAWFAFGWMGVVFTPVVFLLIFHTLDSILWRYNSAFNDALRIILSFYIFQAYSPYLFLLNGGLLALLVAGLTILTAKKKTYPQPQTYR